MKHLATFCLIGLLVVGCGGQAAPPATPFPTSALEALPDSASSQMATGVIQPAQHVMLSFGIAGRVKSVAVGGGMAVRAGQSLATLVPVELERRVARAELMLKSAQAHLAQLQALATPIPQRLAAASVAITNAHAALTQAQTQAGQRPNQDIIDRLALDKAERALEDARREYQKVRDDPRTRDWAPDSPQAHALHEAQQYYNSVLAEYNMHVADRDYAVRITQAQEQLAHAQLTLYEAQHPIEPEALTLAQLDVQNAQLELATARDELERSTLVAPFDGLVSLVSATAGAWVQPTDTIIELLDVSRWRIETKNVSELTIAHIKPGQPVTVRVNAFRTEKLQGRVAAISPVAVVQQGDTTYTLLIDLEPSTLDLKPGMTAQVAIKTE